MSLRVINAADLSKSRIVKAISDSASNAVVMAGPSSLPSKVGPSYRPQCRYLLRRGRDQRSISEYHHLSTAENDRVDYKWKSTHPALIDVGACSYSTPSPSSLSSISSQFIDVSSLADEMRQEVRDYTKAWNGRPLKLVGIISQQDGRIDDGFRHHPGHDDDVEKEENYSDDEDNTDGNDTKTYSGRIAEACAEDGIEFELLRYEQPYEVEHIIQKANQRDDVDGILIFYPIYEPATRQEQQPSTEANDSDLDDSMATPLPRGPYKNKSTGVYYKTFDDYLRDMVDVTKDVEGLCGDYYNRCIQSMAPIQQQQPGAAETTAAGNTMSPPLLQDETIFPCTALSIKQILDRHHPLLQHSEQGHKSEPSQSSLDSSWTGQTVSVVNRSDIVGRPLAAMLASSGANVYSIDVDSVLQFQRSGTKRISPSEESITATTGNTAVTNTASSDSPATETNRQNLEWCLRQSSVVVTAVPDPHFELPCHVIAPGSTVVNVSEYENVNEEEILQQSTLNYIPKIGQVTVAVLEQNLVRLHSRKQREK